MSRDYDTIVIGGGIIGNSIAYYLSEAKSDGILVLDQKFPLCGTSGSTQAWIWIHSKSPSWYAEISLYSAELYGYLQRKIGDFEFDHSGGISPFFTETEREQALHLAEVQAEVGIEIQVLTREEALAREPALSPKIAGAMYSPADGNVNPMRLLEQYMRASGKNGVTFDYYDPVIGIEKQQEAFIVTTSQNVYHCKKLVLSAGIWTRQLGKMLGIDIPIKPVRGQIIITEPLPPLFKHTLSIMRQANNGEVLIGNSQENVGLDRRSTLDVIIETANMGIKYVPALAKARVVRSFGGIRVMPEDGFPILGSVPGTDNLYVAALHSGITLAPLVGTLMAELITEGETSLPLDRYSIARFA